MNFRAALPAAAGLAAALLLSATAWAAPPQPPQGHGEHQTLPPAAEGSAHTDSVYNLSSTWSDQDGARVPLGALRGRPQVVAMIYTHCQYVCPLIVNDMQRIERKLPAALRGKVGFALFSFDPERDSVAALKAYAAKRGLDGRRWRLYTGAPDDVLELAAVLGVRYRKEPNGEFSHSIIVTLLDREGIVRHQMLGQNQDPAPLLAAIAAAAEKDPGSAPAPR
jgi:protein SCO1/2